MASNSVNLQDTGIHNCPSCDKPEDQEMVQCDTCDTWFHFACVGVTEDICNSDWSCAECTEKIRVHRPKKALSTSSGTSASSERKRALDMQRLEEEKLLKEKRDEEAKVQKEARDKEYLDKKYALLENELDAEEETQSEYIRNTSEWLKHLPDFSNVSFTQAEPSTSFHRGEMATVQSNTKAPVSTTWIGADVSSYFSQQVHQPPAAQPIVTSQHQFTPLLQLPQQPVDSFNNQASVTPFMDTAMAHPHHQPVNSCSQSALFITPAQASCPSGIVGQPLNTFNHDFLSAPVPNVSQNLQPGGTRLSADQIAARHVMSKELPCFSGQPEEWPIFISCYETTTSTCGFTHSENMIRLQRCLRGRALEAVRSKLLIPTMVPDVISTLKMLYGRPELIIYTMLQQIRSEPAPKVERLETLVTFALSVQNLCATMESSGLVAHLSNPALLQELTDKLPPQIRLNWAMYKITLPIVTLSTFGNWLFQLARAASEVTITSGTSHSFEKRSQNEKGFLGAHTEQTAEQRWTKSESRSCSPRRGMYVKPSQKCVVCAKDCHKIQECTRFKGLSHRDKWSVVKENGLCRKCLGTHNAFNCRRNSACGVDKCTFKHHPLLHKELKSSEPDEIQPNGVESGSPCNTHHLKSEQVYFRIVPVTLYGNNTSIKTFAFLDEGSALTLIERHLADELKLHGTPDNLCLKWTGKTVRVEKDSRRIELDITGTHENAKKYHMKNVRTIEELNLPVQTIIARDLVAKYPHLADLPLQDYIDAVPRIIIGMRNCNLGLALEYREGAVDEPVATRTRLGWIIHGVNEQATRGETMVPSYHICECTSDNELHKMMKDFFTTESFGVKISETDPESKEDKRSREILESTTRKISERFETGLIWKYDKFNLPDSMPMARRRLDCLEKKMSLDSNYAAEMITKIRDYECKGYARKMSEIELKDRSIPKWYLPIFTVTNPNKPGKLRMVFDAAAKVNGISLNTMLLKGPDQLAPLPAVLYRFRERRIGISGDIREMFHQIVIRKEDQNYQRFLWRDGDTTRKPDVYVMQVMTFGATCSPSAAQYVKNKNALEWAEALPEAAKAIMQNHYVDDWLDSVNSEEEAIKLAKEVKFIHGKAGFEIRNFISNSSDVLQALAEKPEHTAVSMNISPDSVTEKVLGMWWNTCTDTFTYSLVYNKTNKDVLTGQRVPTKREVLRTLMSIFDPLGLLSFFLVFVKILLQDIWRSSAEWDQPINDEQKKKWLSWISVLPMVEKLHISRCYSKKMSSNSQTSTQLHIFVDASENAFAAVAYFRIESNEGTECVIVGAKDRVAPQKPLSIPRLELQAAVLGTRLANSICERHSVQIDRRYFWSDSKTVLYWLGTDPRIYRQFVAFRVGEVLDTTKFEEWRWIPSRQNVADEATKWNRTPMMSSSSRWFNGPEFLKLSEECWPANIWKHESSILEDEVKPHFVHSIIPTISTIDVSRFSKWTRLVRTQAFVLRFIRNAKVKDDSVRIRGPLSSEEVLLAENALYKVAQFECYPSEVTHFVNNKKSIKFVPVEKSSKIYNRSPYMDSANLIRMRGRIDAAIGVSDDTKRPIILPNDHRITHLIVEHFHQQYHHCYHETVVNEIQQKYSIPKIRVVLRSVKRACQNCKNRSAKPVPPEMADLPQARLASFTRPFSYIGIDYFGPLTVVVGRRTEKRWGVLITCLTIRAIHIELAHSLSTDSCIIAIRNFIGRRGTPLEIYSDNGTNFHGANNELRREAQQIDISKLQENFTSSTMKWIFNPPASPHMGGSWERLIGSVKKVLSNINPSRNPSDELLRSLLIEIENIVNSRPLTHVAIESNDAEALTPNHFLLGSTSGVKPPSCFSSDEVVLRKNWKISQQLASCFWRRWVREYLPTLTRRSKWFSSVKPIEKGDVVIIVDENSPTNSWPKGLVIETVIGKNGQVRQAVVQTSSGVLTRPAVKLAVLDVLTNESKR